MGDLFGAATAYYAASRRLPFLIDHALVCGIAFGLAVHLFMTFVPRSFAAYLLVSMLVVGPSISLTVRRYSR